MTKLCTLLAILLLTYSNISSADRNPCVAIAPEHMREWQSNTALLAQAVSLRPMMDLDSGMINAWRVDNINTHRLGVDLGLRIGDRIIAIDDIPVHETEDFMTRLNTLSEVGFFNIDLQTVDGSYLQLIVVIADGADCSI